MIITLIILFVIILFIFIEYNTLVSARQHASEAWADMDVQLKRRHDLIPNLIDVVKGYATHEKEIMDEVATMRQQALATSSDNLSEKSDVEQSLSQSVKQLLAVAENYPELKANEQFLNLQNQLVTTEDEIASARRIYNDNVASYNIKISVFPGNLIANLTQFTPLSFFQNN